MSFEVVWATEKKLIALLEAQRTEMSVNNFPVMWVWDCSYNVHAPASQAQSADVVLPCHTSLGYSCWVFSDSTSITPAQLPAPQILAWPVVWLAS